MSEADETHDHISCDDPPTGKPPGNANDSDPIDVELSSVTSLSLAPDDSRITRLAKLRTDQHRRFQQGAPISVEFYLEQFAAQIDSETAVDLIYSEVLLRAQSGDEPTFDEYVKRFPQYAEPLRQQFEVFGAFQSIRLDSSSSSQTNGGEQRTKAAADGDERDYPQIPGYEILSQLGRGGMGVVWKAKQLGLNRIVALKMLHIGNDAELVARFRTEAETIARLRHVNIVQIFDVGETDGKPYFSMEFVDGGTLAEYESGKPFPARQAAQLAASLARAVHAAHECSVIHRDLKPANILLQMKAGGDDELIPKVADFGLAKQLDQAGDLTASGALMGTPNYMAPEQAEGRTQDIGPAVDVHALGCILYQLLTGQKAFQGQNVIDTLTKIRTQDPPPPSKYNPRIHRDLETICLKCLQKSPSRRYVTADALADDLQRFLDGEPIQARRVSRFERLRLWRRRHPATAVAVLAGMFLALVVLPGWLWYQAELRTSQERERLTRRAAEASEQAKKQSEKAEQAARELARTQEYFALVNRTKQRSSRKPLGWTWEGLKDLKRAAQLHTKVRDNGDLRAEAARCLSGVDVRLQSAWAKNLPQVIVAFSPDGKYLAVADYRVSGFVFPATIRLLDGQTGVQIRKLTYAPSIVFNGTRPVPDGTRSVAFTHDGRQLLVGTRSGRVYRWRLEMPGAKPDMWKIADGKPLDWLLPTQDASSMIVGSSQHETVSRWRLDAIAEKPEVQFKLNGHTKCLAMGTDGETIAYSCAGGSFGRLYSKNLTPVKYTQKTNAEIVSFWPFVFDRSGDMLFGQAKATLRLAHVHLRLAHVHSESLGLVMATDQRGKGNASADLVQLNRDGSLALSLSFSDENRVLQLWDTANGRLQTVIPLPGSHFATAAFHPTKDALVLANDGQLVLYEIGGLQTQARIANQALPVESFAFLPDGKRIVFVATSGERWNVNRAVGQWWINSNRHGGHILSSRSFKPRPDTSLVAANTKTNDIVIMNRLGLLETWNSTSNIAKNWLNIDAFTFQFDRSGRLWVIANENETLQSYSWPDTKVASSWSDSIRLLEGTGHLYCLAAGKNYVVVAGQDGVTQLIRTQDTRLEKSFSRRRSAIRSVAINEAETLAASGFQDGVVRVNRVSDGKIVVEWNDHSDGVTSIDVSRDGKLIATGSRDGTIHLYAIGDSSFRKLMTFDSGPVRQLNFHADGRRLAYLVYDENTVRIWHLDRLRVRLKELQHGLAWD